MKKVSIPKKYTPNLAYLCGTFAGDGSINFRKDKFEYSIKCVGNPRDETEFYINIIKPLFKDVFGLEINIKNFKSEGTIGFVIYSKLLVDYLTKKIKLPLGVKYGNLRIPNVFLKDKELTKNFIRGLFDTDGCISFKKKYKKIPYYPVISIASKSSILIKQLDEILRNYKFKLYSRYNYKSFDYRFKKGFSIISRIDINGFHNLELWNSLINFYSPKHLIKIEKYYKNK